MLKKLLTITKASLISIYSTTIWTKRNFIWTSFPIKPNDNDEAQKNTKLSEYEKVSTDRKRSFQTALPISSSLNIKIEKWTNDSKHGQKIRLNLRKLKKKLVKPQDPKKNVKNTTVAVKKKRVQKPYYNKTTLTKTLTKNDWKETQSENNKLSADCQWKKLSTPLIKSSTIPDSDKFENFWH